MHISVHNNNVAHTAVLI